MIDIDSDHVARHGRQHARTVTQVRASSQALVELAKRRGIAVLLVGHVTKDGAIAGPRVLEHMVDTVLYFEGERGHPVPHPAHGQDRFGPTDEIGVFEMSDAVWPTFANPSALFLGERRGNVSAACVFAGIEGTGRCSSKSRRWSRLLLRHPAPRRGRWGFEPAGHGVAVLEARCGVASAPTTSTSMLRRHEDR